ARRAAGRARCPASGVHSNTVHRQGRTPSIRQDERKMPIEDVPERLPIYARRFHGHVRASRTRKQRPVRGDPELSQENDGPVAQPLQAIISTLWTSSHAHRRPGEKIFTPEL